MGARVMALTAFLAVSLRLGRSAGQCIACLSRSAVLLRRRATSPSSRLQSFTTWAHALPAAHDSTTPVRQTQN